MGWSQVVHDNRKRAELSRAREELNRRKRGYAIEMNSNAGMPAVFTLVGALSGALWWKREGRKVQGRDWRSLPGVEQFLALMKGGKQPSRTAVRGKAKPKQSAKAAVLKAAASNASKPASSSNSSSRPQQQSAPPAVQRQAPGNQANSSGGSSGAKSKKKKTKKKK